MLALTPWTKRGLGLLPRMDATFGSMAEEFKPLFERFFGGWPVLEMPEVTYRYPLTLEEKEKEIVVRVELPGFAPEEVKVEIKGDMLAIEAEHKEVKEEKAGELKVDTAFAEVKREVELPADVEIEKVEALYRHGILEIHLPRKAEVLGRRIEVKV